MKRLRVAAVQTEPVFGAVERNLETALSLVPADVDLAVLPELCNTGYQFRDRQELADLAEPVPDGPTTARLVRFALETATTVCAGLAEADGDRFFNTAVLVRPDGTTSRYRKVHLFWDEKDLFTPGDLGFPVVTACGVPVGMMICFDWLFPEAARSLALGGAALLLHPSNLLLPYCYDAMVTRCLENRVFAVTSNRVGREERVPGKGLTFIGLSQVVGPDGRRLAELGRTETGVAVAELDIAAADKLITPRNDVLADRRPEMYRLD